MKLYRYTQNQRPTLAIAHGDRLFSCEELLKKAGAKLSEAVLQADTRTLCAVPEAGLDALRRIISDESAFADVPSVAIAEADLLAPISDPSKVICIGLNYRDHCEEQNKPAPERPMLFAKFANTIAGPADDVRIPANTRELDFEGELGVVIGRRARNVSRAEALDYVFGYMALLDVSARDLQRSDGQWVRAKSQDGFAPCGPCIVTTDEITDPQNLPLRTVVNGEVMQNSNTGNMIFPVDELIAFVSESLTLEPGDIISTGTPAGVGVHRNPQVLLKSGDVVEVTIEGIGSLRNRFV